MLQCAKDCWDCNDFLGPLAEEDRLILEITPREANTSGESTVDPQGDLRWSYLVFLLGSLLGHDGYL
jgi:hypothetical protein